MTRSGWHWIVKRKIHGNYVSACSMQGYWYVFHHTPFSFVDIPEIIIPKVAVKDELSDDTDIYGIQ